ncbi:methyltransferase domain-containing protein [Xylariales sp. AK1849]|nr:methyltransferase domain-containing protein [Xylariales sp. AK1849]
MLTLPGPYASIEHFTHDLCEFIGSPLIRQITGGIHVNDALIHNAWEALPSEWTAWWTSLPDHRLVQLDLIDSIDESPMVSPKRVDLPNRPASLTKWLRSLKSLSLIRAQWAGPELSLPDVLTTRMRAKKIAEVSAAAAYIQGICQANDIIHIIDMGSGQGYLSLTLAYLFPSLRILAIDGSESQITGSKEFAASLGISGDRVKHLVRYIDGTAPLAAEMEVWAGGKSCMLIGLHACGRLSEHMLRYFATLPFITSLAAVGCCYNHIVPLSISCPDGFPISANLRQRGVELSATALMTGCQAPNNWERSDLDKSQPAYPRRHFYRALLEKVFYDHDISFGLNVKPAWGTSKSDLASFLKFARKATHRLGIDRNKISEEELMAYEVEYRDYEGKIAILWTLSVLCCKIVESVIGIDRYWFLVEQGASQVDVLPIFDYKVSPRNLMMVAGKDKS